MPRLEAASQPIAAYIVERAGDPHRGLWFEESEWTWGDVVAEAAARAELLRRLRAEAAGRPHPGGPWHVGVLLDNVPEYVFLLLGAALAGATVVGVNPTRRGSELARDISHTDCQVVFTDTEHASLLAGLDLGDCTTLLVDEPEYAALAGEVKPAPLPSRLPGPAALYLLIFTAGSTGAPKAVKMSQGRAALNPSRAALAFSRDDVLYCAMPLFHGNALLANLFPALIAGSAVILKRRFSASGFLPDVRRHGCTYVNYVGRVLSYILAVPESPDDADNALRWALGSEASAQHRAEFTRRFRCPVFEGYGSSENAVIVTPSPDTPPGAIGRPDKGMDVAIVDPETGAERAIAQFDEEGHLLNPAEAIGEIIGRNTVDLFEGYYNNPEAEAARARYGWYWTGDLGYRDAEGFVYFAGRNVDWIRVDGENFSAGSVERILDRYEPASGAAVYGVPDPVAGDQVMACLEMADPAVFDAPDFGDFLSEQPDLGTKWAPRFVRVVSGFPVTGAGKVDKVRLRTEGRDVPEGVWYRPGKSLSYVPYLS